MRAARRGVKSETYGEAPCGSGIVFRMSALPKPYDSSPLVDFDAFVRLVDDALRWRAPGAIVERPAGAVRWRRGEVTVELRPLCPVTCSLAVRRAHARYGEVRFQRRDEAAHVAQDVELFLRTGGRETG